LVAPCTAAACCRTPTKSTKTPVATLRPLVGHRRVGSCSTPEYVTYGIFRNASRFHKYGNVFRLLAYADRGRTRRSKLRQTNAVASSEPYTYLCIGPERTLTPARALKGRKKLAGGKRSAAPRSHNRRAAPRRCAGRCPSMLLRPFRAHRVQTINPGLRFACPGANFRRPLGAKSPRAMRCV
jgi:hypothetical protein